jgi:penicillin-binding protein 2
VIDSYLGSRPQRDRRPIRFLTFGIITILVFGVLTTRLAYLQITNGATFAARAEANRTTERSVPAPRGLILDSQGRPLVRNVASFAVKVTPADLPFSEREDVARRL